jgi:hypothetical protein
MRDLAATTDRFDPLTAGNQTALAFSAWLFAAVSVDLRDMALYLVSGAAVAYFMFHAQHGARGLERAARSGVAARHGG